MTRFRALLCALLLPCALDAQQTTVTPNIGLQLPGYNSTNWQVPVYYDFNKLDSIFGGTQSIPSLHITGNLQVDGTFLGASGGVTNSQVIGAIGFTPLNPASNLSDVTNAPAALLNLGGFPAQIPAAWSSGTTYSKYALVLGSDSNTYISNATSNTNNNPTAAGSAYWSKFAGGGAAAVGGIGTVQVASNTGGLAAATPANLFAALGYTPLNPANNASDFASPSTALSNLGGATTASVTAAAATANAALPKAGGNMTGSVTFLSGGVNVPFGAFNGGSAEIGSQATSGTGFVDLHSDGSNTDFNVRLQSTGGTPGVAGSGNASILGATLSAPATTVPALTISGVTSAGCGQISASGQVTSTGAPCGTGSATLPASTAPNQALVATSSGSTSYTPTTLAPSATTDTTNAANIGSGTLNVARLPTIPYSNLSGTPTIPNFQTAGSANATQTSLNIAAGSNVTVANSGNTVTISSTGGGAASFTPSAIQFATSSSATRAATTSDINSIIASGHFQSLWQTSKRPRVDVSHSDFGVDGSYATGQSPACTTDNTAAFTAAIGYALALAATNQSAPQLYVPTGCYNDNSGFLFQGLNAGLSIVGDGSGNTIINFTGTSGYAIKLIGGNLTSQQYGRINLKGFTLQGTGHLTGATLLELQNVQNADVDDVALKNTGGVALNLVNTERSAFTNLEIDASARSIGMVISSNEDYFFNTHVMSPGVDFSNYVYNGNVNAVSGSIPTSGATVYPNHNAAVSSIGGQNVHFIDGSCKGTIEQGCFQFFAANQFSVEGMYVEAFGPGTQNPDLQVDGYSHFSTLTTAMTTSTTTAPVNAALYQPFYVTDQASIANFASGWGYDIQPWDYTYPGDTTASAIGGGITKGSRERVTVAAFYGAAANGAGSVQISGRGAAGTTALAWPAGAVFALPQINSTSADIVSREMHYNGNLGVASGNTPGCSQNTRNASWLHSTTVGAPVGTPAMPCAEKIIGPVYDGIASLTPNRGFSPDGTLSMGTLAEENDYDYIASDSATQVGDGLDFISLNGIIKLNKYDCGAEQTPVTNDTFPASGSPIRVFHSYRDGVCKIDFGFFPADNGSDSYAHAVVNNLVTGGTVDASIKAYKETATAYQPYGSKIGPNFWGDYVIQDLSGAFKEDHIGIPFTNPEFKLTLNGSQVFDVLPGAVTIGGTLAVSGAITGTASNASAINGVAVTGTPTAGYALTATSPTAAAWQAIAGGSGGSGTVTSVGAPPFTTVTNASTTPTFTLSTQAANAILAGPASGGATAPTFRSLVPADIPSLSTLYDAAGAAAAVNTYGALPSNPIPVPAGGAEYPMLDGSGTTVADVSGNGNNATFVSGNAPSWLSYGVSFDNLGASANYQAINTPLTTWGTFYIAHCTPTLLQTTGITAGTNTNFSYPTMTGSSVGTSGVIVTNVNSHQNTYNSVVPTIYGLSANQFTTSLTAGYGNCHVYSYSAGSSTDHILVDGTESASYQTQGGSLANIPISGGGTYQIGTGGGNFNSDALRGVVEYAIYYPGSHTVAQMQLVTKYIQTRLSLRATLPHYPNPLNSNTGQLVFVGDSLTAGLYGTSVWTTAVTPNLGYLLDNYGITGMSAIDMCKMGDNRWVQSIVPGQTTVFFWGGTNDVSHGASATDAWVSLLQCARVAHANGARAVVATMIDRTGYSATHDSLNALIRKYYKTQGGFDYLEDLAEVSGLGADGANTNTACFYSDHVHLTGPGAGTCATIGSTALSGYGIAATLASNVINTLDGSTQQNPDTTASNAFVSTYANNYVIQTPTAAATYSLVDCQGQSSNRTLINGSTTYSITVSAINSQTITGSTTVAPGNIASYTPVLTGPTTGGCFWVRTQ